MMSDEQKAVEELVTIAGGVDLEVSYQNNGSKEMVKVRQIPISKFTTYIMSLGNEADLIELYCDKSKGWADTLSLASANAVADKGLELNLPFFKAWFHRQAKLRESQEPMITGTGNAPPPPIASPSASSPPVSPTTTS
jgi:hypothetical protein